MPTPTPFEEFPEEVKAQCRNIIQNQLDEAMQDMSDALFSYLEGLNYVCEDQDEDYDLVDEVLGKSMKSIVSEWGE